MLKTFNCGIGMVVIVDQSAESQAIACLRQSGEEAFVIGTIENSDGAPTVDYR